MMLFSSDTCRTRAPGSPGHGPAVSSKASRSATTGRRGSADVRAAHRRRLPGVQRRPALGGLPHLRRQDAGARERHDHRAHRRRRADAGRARRLRHRADGARADRLHDQHRREPLSRPPLRAELHAAPRLAVPRRRRALRAGHHPHLRRAVPGDRAARDRRLHPRLPRALEARRARSPPRSSTTASARICWSATPAAPNTRSSPRPRSAACRSTPRRPATARSA